MKTLLSLALSWRLLIWVREKITPSLSPASTERREAFLTQGKECLLVSSNSHYPLDLYLELFLVLFCFHSSTTIPAHYGGIWGCNIWSIKRLKIFWSIQKVNMILLGSKLLMGMLTNLWMSGIFLFLIYFIYFIYFSNLYSAGSRINIQAQGGLYISHRRESFLQCSTCCNIYMYFSKTRTFSSELSFYLYADVSRID